jgi:hypothetical protein
LSGALDLSGDFHSRPRRPFVDNLGLTLRELRRDPAFAELPGVPWAVFVAIACYWQGHAEAWPGQETIAAQCGFVARSVRTSIALLEERSILRVRRERTPEGVRRAYYAPGPATLAALVAMEQRFPRGARVGAASRPPDRPSTPPEPRSADHRKEDPVNWLMVWNQEEQGGGASEARDEEGDLARIALGEYFRRRHPRHSTPPERFDPEDVDAVTRCARAVDGDREAKLESLRDAIEGAFRLSKGGAPSVRFIWGRREHFLDHAERGRRARVPRKEREGVRTPSPVHPRAATPAEGRVPPDQLEADLVRLFGPGWRNNPSDTCVALPPTEDASSE